MSFFAWAAAVCRQYCITDTGPAAGPGADTSGADEGNGIEGSSAAGVNSERAEGQGERATGRGDILADVLSSVEVSGCGAVS
jgi:hypothetical protein